MRQSRQIVAAIDGVKFTSYVEPFCGALWSVAAVMERFKGLHYTLNDVNPYLICFWRAAYGGWNPPKTVTERDYQRYNKTRPVNDPMTGYLGFTMSFGGKFFGGWARDHSGARDFPREAFASTMRKIELLRQNDVTMFCGDFRHIKPMRGSVVYLDPPYTSRTAQAKGNGQIDRDAYYAYAEHTAKSCTVIATEFLNPRGWPVIHNYGDTVVRHLNAKPKDGTCELLLRVIPTLTPSPSCALKPTHVQPVNQE